jgi:hypothetical protein
VSLKTHCHFILFFAIITFVSCGSGNSGDNITTAPNLDEDNETLNPAPSEINFTIPMHWAGHKKEVEWNNYLKAAIHQYGQDLLKSKPRDIARYADDYESFNLNERYSFWAHFISLMAKRESNFNPDTKYVEGFSDSSGKKVVSRGLLQLSLKSSQNYGCPVKYEQDLHSAKKNLICGVKILNHWVKQDKVISASSNDGWRGGARYWAVLRGSKQSHNYIKHHSLSVF